MFLLLKQHVPASQTAADIMDRSRLSSCAQHRHTTRGAAPCNSDSNSDLYQAVKSGRVRVLGHSKQAELISTTAAARLARNCYQFG
eukprot:366539-Chlamydomonas_euryale.AAC.14